ncbi:MAG: hypothetical protein H7Y41_04645 [Hyphomonadaceae bacterium]|nr:hypothetical protein [Clostridia bacterium]
MQQDLCIRQAPPPMPYPPTAPFSPMMPYPYLPMQPMQPVQPPPTHQGPPPITDYSYIPGFLKSMIGKSVRCEFIIGTGTFTDRTGILIEVGVNYFVLRDVNSNTITMCDLYSVRFVTALLT